jgi:hypothetical protein
MLDRPRKGPLYLPALGGDSHHRFKAMTTPYIEPRRQRLTTKRGKRCITHRVWFDSLQQCAAWAGDQTKQRWSLKASTTENEERTAFTGTRTFEDALSLVTNGWSEGRNKLVKGVEALALKKELAQLPAFVYDVAGARPEVPLAVAGDPCCMWDANPLQDAAAPVLRFVISSSASCRWEIDALIRWGTSILSVVDSLEANGRCSVELSVAKSTIDYDDKRRLEFITKVKNAGQHIDFDVMAFAIAHPSMLRRIGFACSERIVEDGMEDAMGDGYGRPTTLSEDALDGAYYVPGVDHCGIAHHVIQHARDDELFNAVMNGFQRLVDGKPFSEKNK